ncbi:hypothetical protein [Photobacterium lutimaris]|uniref:Uncharacterized protein n=1 Tax=Photobacterium lutimaris TaxID=388278 RepID=A0A2T3IQ68_9GAMM|nr:hypothetical protein [Photobacterium lutimaris]PSU30472.1 hypothetical protein C9I99_23135 [Photobacterium lutimaris]TDR76025.1 hypothetical protein DFP78_10310 [Photobacterium lutimaris]
MNTHKQIALDAIELVRPAIERLFSRTNRQELHIVVMDPRVKPWEVSFEEAILVETSIGQPDAWTIPFDQLARKKAQQAWRDSQANINHQTNHPSSLRDDDVLYYGSFVYGNVVVACSGVQQWYDMLISGWIALAIEQLTINDYQTQKIENPTQTYRREK